MDSLDAEIIAWISKALVVKGGPGSGAQPGHAFNGNQYTTGSGGGSEKREQAAAGGPPPPHEFSGNQYPKPNWGDKNLTRNALKDVKAQEGETKTAAQVMEAVNRYADAHPDTMNGYSDKESHIKFIAEHEDAIPKWLVDKVTQKDVDVLEDNNYHTANTVIASQRPDIKGWTNEKALAQWDTQKSAEISKGDLPGHPFRGNQYTEGSLSDTATRLAAFVTKERTNIPPATAHDIADSHREHATLHRQAADQLRQHVDIMTSPENLHRDGEATTSQVKATIAQAKEYAKAADLHDTASVAHQKAADTVLKSQGEYGGKLGLSEKAPTATQVSSASSNAAKASVAAENIVPFEDANVQLPLGAPYYGG